VRATAHARAAAVVSAAAAVTLFAGCGSSTAGEPTREQPSSTVPQDDSTETSTKASHSVDNLCDLLTEEEAAGLGAPKPPEKGFSTSDGHPQCTWSGDLSLTVGWSAGMNTSMLKTGPDITITPIEVDGLHAVLSKQTGSAALCQVAVDLPDGVLGGAVVLDLSGEGRYDECTVATEAMNIIIPKVTEK